MIKVAKHIARPLVRFCVRRSVKLQDLVEVLKVSFLEVAKEELEREGEAVSSTRLSVMTGVHRKDVKRLLEEGAKEPGKSNLIGRVLGQWQQDPRFTTKAGKARTLSVDGVQNEFRELVESVSVDLNPYAVLFELERINAVERTSKGVKLVARFYLPKGDLESGFSLLESDLNDLITSVEENVVTPDEEPHLHLKTEYDSIPAKFVPEIKDWLLNEGTLFHEKTRRYLSQYDSDVNPDLDCDSEDKSRVAVGMFSYSEKPKKTE